MKIYRIDFFDEMTHTHKYIPALDMKNAACMAEQLFSNYKKTVAKDLVYVCRITAIGEVCELDDTVVWLKASCIERIKRSGAELPDKGKTKGGKLNVER